MTSKARVVLQDAKAAIEAHTDTLQSESFRISWIAVVTLLRAVGHVLVKVDAPTSTALQSAVNLKWKELTASRPHPKIYWGFIEPERNRFLKEYEHGISRKLITRGPIINGGQTSIHIDVGNARGGEIGPGRKLSSTIASGPYAGESERAVAWLAYDWWSNYLDDVDRLAKQGDA